MGILRLLFTPFLFIADLFPKRLPPGIVKETIKVPSRDVGRFIKVHIYKPLQQNPSNYQVLLPVHLNFFGSGYLFDTHGKDWKFCSYFAKRLNMIVLDCDYRTFPHAFPSAYNDCVDLVKWCSSRTDRGWDVNKISIAGRSSGGNLALSVSSTFPDLIKSVVSLYPPTDFRISATDERFLKSPSQVSRAGMPLTRSMLKLCDQAYVLPGIDREDPRLSVIFGKASSFPQHVWVACGNADILYVSSEPTRPRKEVPRFCSFLFFVLFFFTTFSFLTEERFKAIHLEPSKRWTSKRGSDVGRKRRSCLG